MKITDEMIEAAALSDAEFDGRNFVCMGRVDRDRYMLRAKASLTAALSASPTGVKPLERMEDMRFPGELPTVATYASNGTSAIEPAGVGVETPPPSTHLMGRHSDQTSPMTVGPEAFLEEDTGLLDQVERLVEAYVGGEYEAQRCAAEHILADIRELRQPTAPQPRASVPASLKGDEQ